MDGLPVKDAWIDEVKTLIDQIKSIERERVSYMTYQMIIDEERNEAHEQGRVEGESRLSRLMAILLRNGQIQEATDATESKELRNQLYQKYGIV